MSSPGAPILASTLLIVAMQCPHAAADPPLCPPCEPTWLDHFRTDLGGPVRAMAVWDDGGGPALFVGGEFKAAGGWPAHGIARWGAGHWSPLRDPDVAPALQRTYALAVFDDGSGPAVYAGGLFVFDSPERYVRTFVARWDGRRFRPVGPDMQAQATALAVFDDGAGPALYAATRDQVFRWDGSDWVPVGGSFGGGLSGATVILEPFDDGMGPALYAAGEFTTVGGLTVNRIARWDGAAWSPLVDPLTGDVGVNGPVYALEVHDDWTGSALYLGGSFTRAGRVAAPRIARWTGSDWSTPGGPPSGQVNALRSVHEPIGPALHAGGGFSQIAGVAATNIARWNGLRWSPVGSGITSGTVYTIESLDSGQGPRLIAGGDFGRSYQPPGSYIAQWNGATWGPLGAGIGGAPLRSVGSSGPFVYAMHVFDDGTGPGLYIGGLFTHAGDLAVNGIARRDARGWSAAGSGVSGSFGWAPHVRSMATFDDGAGPALYVGGHFANAGGQPARHIAKWDGSRWHAVLPGFYGGEPGPLVNAMAVYDDGGGPALYIGGGFSGLGGIRNLIRWNGVEWSDPNARLDGCVKTPAPGPGPSVPCRTWVAALTAFDEGAAPALCVGGSFREVNSLPAHNLVRLIGAAWTPFPEQPNYEVNALCAWDQGPSPGLHVGGWFTQVGSTPANGIVRWDGQRWTALGDGVSATTFMPHVATLAAHDDGRGPALFVGGRFERAGNERSAHVARWDGAAWSAMGMGLSSTVSFASTRAIASFDDGAGPALFVGGDFTQPAGSHNGEWASLIRWGCPPEAILRGDVNGDRRVDAGDVAAFAYLLIHRSWSQLRTCRAADMNADRRLDGADVPLFVAAVLGGG